MKEGETAEFSCHAIGDPVPELYWFYKDQPLQSTGRYIISHKAELTHLQVQNMTPADVGDYSAIAKNSFGEATCTANLEVERKSAHC